MTITTRRRQIKVVGVLFFLVMLGAGPQLGTQSSLTWSEAPARSPSFATQA